MSLVESCQECGVISGKLLRCSRCKVAYYCSKEHQKKHWKRHKKDCKIVNSDQPPDAVNASAGVLDDAKQDISNNTKCSNNSSTEEMLASFKDNFQVNLNIGESSLNKVMGSARPMMPFRTENLGRSKKSSVADFREFSLLPHKIYHDESSDETIDAVIDDLNTYGVCVINNFLGAEKGTLVLNEVLEMYKKGVFKDGQLVSDKGNNNNRKNIRSDQITWISGREKGYNCDNISDLVHKVDSLIIKANKKTNNGILGQYTINSRTGAMVACYPGHGTHYVKHIDNPNRDGRCITAIYYLNVGWEEKNGGLLLIDPVDQPKFARVEPIFDRMLFFWSDRRNPHEVKPAYTTRYAITLWYFDASEREEYLQKNKREEE